MTDITGVVHPGAEKFLLTRCKATVCASGRLTHFYTNASALASTKTRCYALVSRTNTCAFDFAGMCAHVCSQKCALSFFLFASLGCHGTALGRVDA